MSIPEFELESDEFLQITPTLSGQAHTTGVVFAIMLDQARPVLADFQPAQVVGQEIGVMTGGRAVKGTWHVWYRITDALPPESPWVDCGPTFKTV